MKNKVVSNIDAIAHSNGNSLTHPLGDPKLAKSSSSAISQIEHDPWRSHTRANLNTAEVEGGAVQTSRLSKGVKIPGEVLPQTS